MEPTEEGQNVNREVEVGEWFNPFTDYDGIPYKSHSDDNLLKLLEFKVKGLGKMEYALESVRVDGKPNDRILLQYSDDLLGQRTIEGWQQQFETRLLEFSSIMPKQNGLPKVFPYKLVLRSPEGKEYEVEFAEGEESFFPLFGTWREREIIEDNQEQFDVFIPEASNIIERLKCKIEKL